MDDLQSLDEKWGRELIGLIVDQALCLPEEYYPGPVAWSDDAAAGIGRRMREIIAHEYLRKTIGEIVEEIAQDPSLTEARKAYWRGLITQKLMSTDKQQETRDAQSLS